MLLPGPLTSRRRFTETVIILLTTLAVAASLHVAGTTARRHAAAPVVRVVSAPHEAFPLWYQEGIRGRTLVLFARYLRADTQEDDEVSFTTEDFPDSRQLEAFCSVLQRDGVIAAGGCSLDTMEGLLRSTDLNRRLERFLPPDLPGPLVRLLRMSEGYVPDYERLPAAHRTRLRRLNRSLLELAYPGICPAHLPYGLTPENYVFLGIKHRIVRRVFHVLPEDAWTEVKGNLTRIPHAVPRGNGYRVTATDGVPVDIMRARDLLPIGETVIVHMNTDVWGEDELSVIANMVRRGRIVTDVLTASGRGAERFLQEARRER